MNDFSDDEWLAIVHGDSVVLPDPKNQTTQLTTQPETSNSRGSDVSVVSAVSNHHLSGNNNTGLVPQATGLAQPDRTKSLAEFWGVSESAIKRWCKGVLEVHGINPTTPYTDTQLCYLAEFGKRCSNRWSEFKGQTGLTRRLSPVEFVQQQLAATGKSSQQRIDNAVQGVSAAAANPSDLQDQIADRRHAVRDQVADQVMAMAQEDYHQGKALAQQASQLLSGQAFLAGFMGELQSELDNDAPTISLLPGASTNYLPDLS